VTFASKKYPKAIGIGEAYSMAYRLEKSTQIAKIMHCRSALVFAKKRH